MGSRRRYRSCSPPQRSGRARRPTAATNRVRVPRSPRSRVTGDRRKSCPPPAPGPSGDRRRTCGLSGPNGPGARPASPGAEADLAVSPANGYRFAHMDDLIAPDEIAYRLDLTAAQLKIVHTALKSLYDDLGHEEHDVKQVVSAVLDKLPGEHEIRAIDLARELRRSEPAA